MKRGFMDRNAEYLPDELLLARRKVFAKNFSEMDLQAAVIYGDVAYADELQFLTNLGPYWSNAVAIIYPDGNLEFVTGLSARVDFWVSMISGVGTEKIIAAGPNLSKKVVATLAERFPQKGNIGMTGAYFPNEMMQSMIKEGFTPIFYQKEIAEQQRFRDEAYQKMLLKGITLMNPVLEKVINDSKCENMSRTMTLANIEYACRTAGAMDTLILHGDENLIFDRTIQSDFQKQPWTLYVQIQYLGEWFCVARNMKDQWSDHVIDFRNKLLKKIKPGLQIMNWEEDGYQIRICDQILSDHIHYQNSEKANIKSDQILNLRIVDPLNGILIEDMIQVRENQSELLTTI
jgi:hypothetical protein